MNKKYLIFGALIVLITAFTYKNPLNLDSYTNFGMNALFLGFGLIALGYLAK